MRRRRQSFAGGEIVRIAVAGTMSVSYIEGEDAGHHRWGYVAAAQDAQFISATEDQEETAVERC
jgi:hypothetical protein